MMLSLLLAFVATRADSGGKDPRAVQPERPSVATHAGTVAPGYLEVETGVERDRFRDGTRALSVPTVAKVGLTSRTQLGVGLPMASASGVPTGFGDATVGLKWRLLEDHPLLQDVAILPSVKLRTGGARGSGTTDWSLLLIDSRAIGPVGLDLNVGVTRHGSVRHGGGAYDTALWTASFGLPVRGALGWGVECYGIPGSGAAGQAPIVALLTGPQWRVARALAVDAGVIVPLEGPQPRALFAGLVANLGRIVGTL